MKEKYLIVSILIAIILGSTTSIWLYMERSNLILALEDTNQQLEDINQQLDEAIQEINDRILTYNELEQLYEGLQVDYETLFNDYKLLNSPVSNFTSVGDLDITIATYQEIYSYKDSISGNVTVYYHNGTAFEGAFIIYLRHVDSTATTRAFNVDGYGEFYVASPLSFIRGPGNYTIGICSLRTTDGYIIESKWRVFPSVQVEAK